MEFSAETRGSCLALKIVFQTRTPQGVASIRVRRATCRIVPRTGAAVHQDLLRLVPGPELDQRVQPHRQMVGRDVGPVVPQLLLTGAVYFLEIVEVLLDGRPIRYRFQNLSHRRLGGGAKVGSPGAVLLAHQHHADQTSRRLVRCQEGLVARERFGAIQQERFPGPTLRMAGTLGQAQPLRTVLAWPATPALT